jgi:hypothetical protein
MKLKKIILLLIILFSASFTLQAQKFFRIKGDFSIKAKSVEGKSQLTMGKFYYDRNIKKLVYINAFPKKEAWISVDTSIYQIENNKILNRQSTPPVAEFSMFHLALNSQLSSFGFKNSALTIEKVERTNDMVITTWAVPEKAAKLFGKIKTSTKNNRLTGIIFINVEGDVLKKQFFNNYKNFNGIEFPQEVVEIIYINGQENYQVTTYKNIIIDDLTEGDIYNYSIPGIR